LDNAIFVLLASSVSSHVQRLDLSRLNTFAQDSLSKKEIGELLPEQIFRIDAIHGIQLSATHIRLDQSASAGEVDWDDRVIVHQNSFCTLQLHHALTWLRLAPRLRD
jgi:hypothetical protein